MTVVIVVPKDNYYTSVLEVMEDAIEMGAIVAPAGSPLAPQPFRLLWPTEFRQITQPFGVNPQIYNKYGLPGHEGLDMRAPNNSKIFACADGVVTMVNTDGKLPGGGMHNYGIHVRITHRDGFQTIYAHFARGIVSVGQAVRAGELIGFADSTGNSTGSHLHLTLKKEGATAAGLTNYPSDIIDPTPYLD